MKKIVLLALLVFLHHVLLSQTDNLQKQINEQVWKPFIKAFNGRDNEAFSAVHSKDVIRVLQDDNTLMGYDEYFQKVPDSIQKRWNDWTRNIELRFIQRIASKDKAFEVGYYKTTSSNSKTGQRRTGYGKFHVLLRKEEGVWKILMDADAHENTDEALFLTAKPLE